MKIVIQPEVSVNAPFDQPDMARLRVVKQEMMSGPGWQTMYYWLEAGNFRTLVHRIADGSWIETYDRDAYPDHPCHRVPVRIAYFEFAEAVRLEALRRGMIS